MTIVPAKVAGVDEVIACLPPNAHKAMIAGCHLSGADRIFKIGGAQAIAALAYGTESVPAVNKIVGPGNAFVNEAKRQVFGPVGITEKYFGYLNCAFTSSANRLMKVLPLRMMTGIAGATSLVA